MIFGRLREDCTPEHILSRAGSNYKGHQEHEEVEYFFAPLVDFVLFAAIPRSAVQR